MNSLKDDLLANIFSYLSDNTLINVSRVCQRWKDIIENSEQLIDRFELAITNGPPKFPVEYLGPQIRIVDPFPGIRYKNLSICGRFKCDIHDFLKLSKIIEVLKYNFMRVKIQNVRDNIEYLQYWSTVEILKEMENLTHLTLDQISLSVYEDSYTLNKLKSLNLINVIGVEAVQEVLSSSPNLEELSIKITYRSSFIELINVPFKLTKLSLDFTFGLAQDEEIITMLLLQSETLRDLSIIHCGGNVLLEFILNELKLEKLEIGVSPYITDLKLRDEHFDLNCFIIRGNNVYFDVLHKIFRHHLAIQTIKFPDWEFENIDSVLTSMACVYPRPQLLETIEIHKMTYQFESLESIERNDFDDLELFECN